MSSSDALLLLLPLVAPDGDESAQWLGNGLARGVLRRLAAAGVRVIAAEVAQRVGPALGIALDGGTLEASDLEALVAQTGATHVAHGVFERAGDALRVDVAVVTPDGASEQVVGEGACAEFCAVLGQVAERVAGALPGGGVDAAGREAMAEVHGPVSWEAFEALAQARARWAEGDVEGFEEEIAAAVELDPLWVEPYEVEAGVARAMGDLDRVVGALQEIARAHGEAERAFEQGAVLLRVGHALVEAGCWDEGVDAYEHSAEVFEDLDEVRGAVQARMNIANVYLRRGDHERAIDEYTEGLERIQEFPEDRAKHAFNLGLALKETGQAEVAVTRLEEALQLGVELRDDELIASAYNALGTVHDDLGDLKRALQHFRRAEEHLDPQADPVLLAGVKDHIGIVLKKQGKLEEALDYSEQACQLFESRADPLHLAIAYVNRAGLLLELEREEEATPFVVEAHREFVRLGSPSAETTALMLERLGLDQDTIDTIAEEAYEDDDDEDYDELEDLDDSDDLGEPLT